MESSTDTVLAPAWSGTGSRARVVVIRCVRHHALFLWVAGTYVALAFGFIVAVGRQGISGYGSLLLHGMQMTAAVAVIFTGFSVVRRRFAVNRESGGTASARDAYRLAWQRTVRDEFSADRAAGVLLVITVLPLVLATFSTVKQLMPDFAPLAWDDRLMRLDAALHLGRHPWEWLQPLLGHRYITVAIDRLYLMPWIMLTVVTVYWQASSPPSKLRTQYLISFVLLWGVLGNIVATLFSSAGPCYLAQVGGDPAPYAGLFAYLQSVGGDQGLVAQQLQRGLWEQHVAHLTSFGNGVSAMPSAHVAKATLCALVIGARSRRLGLLAWAFVLVIQLGTVHLGWHYAVDGYVGALAMIAIWYGVGRMIERWSPAAAA